MRKWALAAAVVVLGLAPVGVALAGFTEIAGSTQIAGFTQIANVTLTARHSGKPTGIRAAVRSSDPTAPGQKPKAATTLALTFPRGTKFNLGTPLVEPCRLSDRRLTAQFGPSCPGRSLIGRGSAIANASPLAATVKAAVKAYVRGSRRIILVVKPTLPGAPTIVVHATVSGSKLTIGLPRVVLGKSPGFPGVTVVFVSLKLNVPALGSGRTALITAGRCKAHEFVVRSRLRYADHSTLARQSSSRCT